MEVAFTLYFFYSEFGISEAIYAFITQWTGEREVGNDM